jgi:hypothetical protein
VKKEKQMTVEQSTDASFDQPADWRSINWTAIEKLVRRLQVRIAKAVQASKRRQCLAVVANTLAGRQIAGRP